MRFINDEKNTPEKPTVLVYIWFYQSAEAAPEGLYLQVPEAQTT